MAHPMQRYGQREDPPDPRPRLQLEAMFTQGTSENPVEMVECFGRWRVGGVEYGTAQRVTLTGSRRTARSTLLLETLTMGFQRVVDEYEAWQKARP